MLLENAILEYIKSSQAYKTYLNNSDQVIECDELDYYPLTEFIKLCADKRGGRTIVICPTEDEAKALYETLSSVKGYPVIFIPSDGRMLYSEFIEKKVNCNRKKSEERFIESKKALAVLSLRSFVSPFLSEKALSSYSFTLSSGDTLDVEKFSSLLASSGYYRVNEAREEGTFAIKGEVIEVFPLSSEKPYRVYLDWDQIERIVSFNSITQINENSIRRLSVPLMGDEEIQKSDIISISTLLRDNDYFIIKSQEKTDASYKALMNEAQDREREAYRKNGYMIARDEYLFSWPNFFSSLKKGVVIHEIMKSEYFHFGVEPSHSYFGNVTFFKDEASTMIKNGWKIFVLAPTVIQKQRLDSVLQSLDVDISVSDIESGFMLTGSKIAVILDQEIFGRRKKRAKTLVETVSSPLDSFVSLKPGDYVVHINYGIGQFEKIDRVKSGETERDYIKIRYNQGEALYVPIEQANLVQKYIGNDGRPPKLDTMGSKEWSKKKEKARENARILASELVHLYAMRQQSHGFPFCKDTDWQVSFEASFPFTETPDQLKCIDEIKKDMESDKCMDRLVCGDVGYGKTEIAFRAAFKAIMGGKQVAFLAPTVILAQQHYENFLKRVEDFPVKSGLSTRFVSAKDNRRVLEGVKNGSIDILFGTHKILSKNVVFKDLGLLIVDEEQRFGVKDKEKIKQMKHNIDSLTLSATPIPRTLYMSLLKVRDMSLLTTAPRERLPIDTYIGEADTTLIKNAITQELKRGGQVFYLHNRVEDLEEVVMSLKRLVPEAIIEYAHGQMDAEKMEDVMHRFIYEGVQVLVSTTVIENGIDIPNVNTIIVDRADRLGLSQLYQLRGRVGRSDRKAYCYLFYPDGGLLKSDAIKRLKVLSENTELGSGFKVSMKDMEIRGAGNILGREQSGHLEAVGLDMYLKLIEEEISRITEEKTSETIEPLVQLDYTGFIPNSYIKDPSQKFELYKKISSIKNLAQLDALKSEIDTRYGTMSEEVENLFCIAEIKVVCRELMITSLKEYRGIIDVEFAQVAILNPSKVVSLISLSNGRVKLDPKRFNHLTIETGTVSLKDKAQLILETLRRLE